MSTTLRHEFDPTIEIPGRTVTGTRRTIEAYIAEEVAYAVDLAEADAPARITVNTDQSRLTFFMVWHMADGTRQTDTFTIKEQ